MGHALGKITSRFQLARQRLGWCVYLLLRLWLARPPVGESVSASRGWLTGAVEPFHPTHPSLAPQQISKVSRIPLVDTAIAFLLSCSPEGQVKPESKKEGHLFAILRPSAERCPLCRSFACVCG